MPSLSIDAIRARAAKFAKEFEGVTSEKQRDQDFMRGFCEVFGINPNRMRWQFELKNGKSTTWADGVLPHIALFEMKTAGKNMSKAYEQAADYIALMQDKDVPEFIIISDFARIHVYHGKHKTEFTLAELPQNIDCLKSLAGYETIAVQRQNLANEMAALKIGKLHDVMKANHYRGHDLETYLVRLLFCLFADDTGLFGEQHRFLRLLEHTKADGTDLHGELERLFNTLNKDTHERPPNLPERFQGFPYVNGSLFANRLDNPYDFDEDSRTMLLELAHDNWSDIDPSIFGSLFQAIMHHEDEAATGKSKKRRELGAHYTSEANILKVINPLFLDDLRKEFESAKRNTKELGRFHDKLASLQFFDPACGCGNFLVVAYRELRLLELQVIETLHGTKEKNSLQKSDVALMVRLDVDHFHGIEIDSTAARIATVAMWLTDHQMNLKLSRLGGYMHRLPLKKKPNIVCGNALQIDWATVIAPEHCSYIMGNPPFIGYSYQSQEQKADLASVFTDMKGAGVLDYVTAWHIKAARYIQLNPLITVGFVSTNSITQGEQVAILWAELLRLKIHIHFAHRTFCWSNDGRGIAAVHCVIIGFGLNANKQCRLFDYVGINDDVEEKLVSQINPYLVAAPTVLIDKRRQPLSHNIPDLIYGNEPREGGFLILSQEEKDAAIEKDINLEKWIRRIVGANDFINNLMRYCLWLVDANPQDIRKSDTLKQRIHAVKEFRQASLQKAAHAAADTPQLFVSIRQPKTEYLLIPIVSSERRSYVPIGYMQPDVICTNANFMLPNATLFHFGILTSTMHNAWMRAVCGRLESRYRYSNTVVYNNFPWPENPDNTQKTNIEKQAQAVLDARVKYPESTLADLYDPLAMPKELIDAHRALDKAVDAAYANDGFDKKKTTDADRVAFLFSRYEALTKPLLPTENTHSKKNTKKAPKETQCKVSS